MDGSYFAYEGFILYNCPHGIGTLKYLNNKNEIIEDYQGDFHLGRKNGLAKVEFPKDHFKIVKGYWENNELISGKVFRKQPNI